MVADKTYETPHCDFLWTGVTNTFFMNLAVLFGMLQYSNGGEENGNDWPDTKL